MWQNASTAQPIHIQRSTPRAKFHVHVRKSVHSWSLTIPTKKSPGTKSETQQEVGYCKFSRHILCHIFFAIFRCQTLTNSSQRFIQMNTKIGHCNLKAFVTLNCEDLEFSSEGVSMVSCQISMFRHETGSCYNSGMQCPICTNLHMFGKTPDMKRSTWPYSVIVTAPPAGNRKWHVLLCN